MRPRAIRAAPAGTRERAAALSIAAVERETGLSKDTLRVWERRYGFPQPGRDASGERVYSATDVGRLRVIKRLMDRGHRPGRIVGLPLEDLRKLAQDAPAAAPEALRQYLELLKGHRIDALRTGLSQAALRLGLARFVTEIVTPLTALVGEAWARGDLEVFEEHLYTEALQVVLRLAIGNIAARGARPRVLLTTVPQEWHGLGLLMAEAMLAVEGCDTVSLGVRTPLADVVAAAKAQQADIVALSFSLSAGAAAVLDSLGELRARLPRTVELWAGGACPVLHRRPPAGVRTFRTLDLIAPAVAEWRAAHPA